MPDETLPSQKPDALTMSVSDAADVMAAAIWRASRTLEVDAVADLPAGKRPMFAAAKLVEAAGRDMCIARAVQVGGLVHILKQEAIRHV